MTELAFDTQTKRFGLPLLFSGQAQKELFVNEMACRIDCLLHPAVEGIANTPPAVAEDGDAWIISQSATDNWIGREGQIACRHSGQWLYFQPVAAMKAFDKSGGRDLVYRNGWIAAQRPSAPAGGATVDTEARAAIQEIVAALSTYGIFSV